MKRKTTMLWSLLMLVMALLSVDVQAGTNLYIYGDINGANNWGSSPLAQYEFQETGTNDVYTLYLDLSKESWFRIKDTQNNKTYSSWGGDFNLSTHEGNYDVKLTDYDCFYLPAGQYSLTLIRNNNENKDKSYTIIANKYGSHFIFYDGNNIKTPRVYAWGNNFSGTANSFPGDYMTKKDGKWYWSFSDDKSMPYNIIISDNGSDTNRVNVDNSSNLLYYDKATYHDSSVTKYVDPSEHNPIYVYAKVGTDWNYKTPEATFTWNETEKKYVIDNPSIEIKNNKSHFFLSYEGEASNRDWDSFNGNRYTPGSDVSFIGTDVAMALHDSGTFMIENKNGSKAELVLNWNEAGLTQSTLRANVTDPDPEPEPDFPNLYVYGVNDYSKYVAYFEYDEVKKNYFINNAFTVPANNDYYFFLSTKSDGGSSWGDFNGTRYTPGTNQDVLSDARELKKVDSNNYYIPKSDKDRFIKLEFTLIDNKIEGSKIKGIATKKITAPEHLYMYVQDGSDWDFSKPVITFTWDPQQQVYNSDKDVYKVQNTTFYTILSSQLVPAGTEKPWDYIDGNNYRYSAGSSVDATTQQVLKKATSGAYTVGGGTGRYSVVITWNGEDAGDTNYFQMVKIDEDNGYYLTGDFNAWAKLVPNNNENGDPYIVSPEEMESYKLTKDTERNGWYKSIKIPRLHGQFQILDENCSWLTGDHYGLNIGKDNSEYWNKPVPTSEPSEANLNGGTGTYGNLHLAHNYYENVYIHFNPTLKKIYLSDGKGGEPKYRDLYIFYSYVDENGTEDTPDLTIINNVPNENNYAIPPKATTEKFAKVNRVDIENLLTAKQNKWLSQAGVNELWRARIYPCLEEENITHEKDNEEIVTKKHYFTFKISDSDMSGVNGTEYTIDGESFFFMNKIAPRLAFQVTIGGKVHHVSDPNDDIAALYHRYIMLDKNGKAHYVKEDMSFTDNINEALTHEVYGLLDVNEHQKEIQEDFPDANGIYHVEGDHGDHEGIDHWWRGLTACQAALANAYIEYEIVRKSHGDNDDPKYESGLTEYVSDFTHQSLWDIENSSDPDQPSYIRRALRQAEEEGKTEEEKKNTIVLTMKTDNPVYKLNGEHQVVSYQSEVPVGVRDIKVDGNEFDMSKAEYYTLQGVKVSNPVKGQIYIVVSGKSSRKILF